MYNNELEKSIKNIDMQCKKALEPLIDSTNKAMKSISQFTEQMKIMLESVNSSLDKFFSNIKNIDFNKIKLNLYKDAFIEYKEVIDLLYKKTIFPPISYLAIENIHELDETDLETWILSNEVKEFYLDSINTWKLNYSNEKILSFIDEIYSNFKSNNYISVTLLIYTLLECLYNQTSNDVKMPNKYKKIKEILKEQVFSELDILYLYDKFIKSNLYAKTEDAEEFTRHIVHGDIENITPEKTAMNAIFIYDFIQEILILKN